MAKKKKSHHKKVHRAKASRGQRSQVAAASAMPAAPAVDPAPTAAAPSRPTAPAVSVVPAIPVNPRLAYLAGDLSRIGILVVVCVVIELGLWFLVRHTGFGSQLFRAIHI